MEDTLRSLILDNHLKFLTFVQLICSNKVCHYSLCSPATAMLCIQARVRRCPFRQRASPSSMPHLPLTSSNVLYRSPSLRPAKLRSSLRQVHLPIRSLLFLLLRLLQRMPRLCARQSLALWFHASWLSLIKLSPLHRYATWDSVMVVCFFVLAAYHTECCTAY